MQQSKRIQNSIQTPSIFGVKPLNRLENFLAAHR